jgi:hypothetical protein
MTELWCENRVHANENNRWCKAKMHEPPRRRRLCTRQRLCPTVRMLFVTLSCVTAAQLPSERRDPQENSSDELVVNADSQPLAFGRPRRRLPHSSYLSVYGRAVLMLATVVVAQTVGSASWMGPLAGPVLAWSALRAEYVLQPRSKSAPPPRQPTRPPASSQRPTCVLRASSP